MSPTATEMWLDPNDIPGDIALEIICDIFPEKIPCSNFDAGLIKNSWVKLWPIFNQIQLPQCELNFCQNLSTTARLSGFADIIFWPEYEII